LLNARFPKEVSKLIVSCFQSKKRRYPDIASAGEYETCLEIPKDCIKAGLRGACSGGHIKIVDLMISYGASDFNGGLYEACVGGHIEIVRSMISHGATDFNHGLYEACVGGHIEIVRSMISHGATDFNHGLYMVCYTVHKKYRPMYGYDKLGDVQPYRDIAQLMITHGASKCAFCFGSVHVVGIRQGALAEIPSKNITDPPNTAGIRDLNLGKVSI
jgi:hypothetical protein